MRGYRDRLRLGANAAALAIALAALAGCELFAARPTRVATPHAMATATLSVASLIYLRQDDDEVAARVSDGAIIWRAAGAGGAGLLAGGALYVGGGVVNSFAGALAALDPLTGARRWRIRLASGVSGLAFYQNPGGAAMMIATTSAPEHVPGGVVYGVRASDGAVLWHLQSDYSAILGGPIIGGSTVFVDTLFSIYALDAVSGYLRWRVSRDNPNNIPITGALALINGVLYAGASDGAVIARRASDGAILQRYALAGAGWQAISESGDTLYFSDNPGNITAIRTVTRSVLWRRLLGNMCGDSPFVASIFYTCGSFLPNNSRFETLTAIDAATGAPLWNKQPFTIGEHHTLTGEIPYQAATLAGTLYIVSVQYNGGFPVVPDGALSALDPDTGAERWSISGGYGGPSLPASMA